MSVLLRTIKTISLMFVSTELFAAAQMDLTPGVTAISQEVYELHTLVLWICVVIGAGVFGVIFYSMFAHRKSKGAVSANFHDSMTVEVLWTVVPFLILVGMAVPAAKTLIKMETPADDAEVTIKITGYQWKWNYDYMHEGFSFFSNLAKSSRDVIYAENNKEREGINYLLDVDNRMVIPAGKKVRFLMTSNDVIHSWWIPAFAVKKDAIPGYINEAWTIVPEPGVYRGQCAELCGKDHGFMPIVVEVKSEADYAAWVSEKKGAAMAAAAGDSKVWTMDELMAKGEQVYAQCSACHQISGEGIPAAGFPALKGGAIATGPVAAHLDIVINGSKVNPAMAAYGAQLSDADLAAVITYERNAWGNNTGDAVQPADVKAARK
ncbi:MAG: cytochrome c oxidase subunit II [Gammaproteobacteria bacterium]|nr:cytochrome c oxidase subunit II [Gammaproteobacteria bacterium]